MKEETRKLVRQCLGDGGRLGWPKGEAWVLSFGGGRNIGRVALAEHRDKVRIRVPNISGRLNHRRKTGGVRDDDGCD